MVATHKPYWMPQDDVYLPIHVGCDGKESIGFTGDNTGDNISAKNPHYCELTALYWAWKNLQADYTGLVHYLRYFTNKEARSIEGKRAAILSPTTGRGCWPRHRSSWPTSGAITSNRANPITCTPIMQKACRPLTKSSARIILNTSRHMIPS